MSKFSNAPRLEPRHARPFIIGIIVIVVGVLVGLRLFKAVEPGHVAVATLFGKVQEETYVAGMHFPVNPLYAWHEYDARQKSHKERVGVPSQDQLTTDVELSVQYRIISSMAGVILQDTGTAEQAKEVHLIPKVRSMLREQGKTIKRAEDFFMEETQQRLQDNLKASLGTYLQGKGIEVQDVLIRDIDLPPSLVQQIEEKKTAEQQVEKEKASLAKKRVMEEQRVVTAAAQRQAAEEDAKRQMVLADAEAYRIQKINEMVASSPAYVQLEAIAALKEISKDPATKIYFINGESPMPLPLMHMGDPVMPAKQAQRLKRAI